MKVPIQFCRPLFSLRRIFRSGNAVASYFTVPSYRSTELNTVSLKSNEKNYLRSVLSKCRGCILYEPIEKLNVRDLITLSPQTPAAADATPDASTKHLFEDELVQNLSNSARIGFTLDPNVVSRLESQCFREYKTWSIEKQLLVLELWHHVPESIQIKFIWSARNELLARIRDLSHDHALQTLYYVTWLRQRMPGTQQQMLQTRFVKEINSMTLEAMSVWCLAMFRNQAAITSRKLIEEIYAKLLQNDLKKFHDIGLASVLKVRDHALVRSETHRVTQCVIFPTDDSPLVDGLSSNTDDATTGKTVLACNAFRSDAGVTNRIRRHRIENPQSETT